MPASKPAQSEEAEDATSGGTIPSVIGIYGLPGSGKTHLLTRLREMLCLENFSFYEGSQMIASLVPGGLLAFQTMDPQDKTLWRQKAINRIKRECGESRSTGIVTGHVMFWTESESQGEAVYTQSDLETFSSIFYLDVPADLLVQQRTGDVQRPRSHSPANHLERWQDAEKDLLRKLCYENKIMFMCIPPLEPLGPSTAERLAFLFRNARCDTEAGNSQRAVAKLDDEFKSERSIMETVLVMDADKTLTAQDTGAMFWDLWSQWRNNNLPCPLEVLFRSPAGYSFDAFRQMSFLYEEATNVQEFDALCELVASRVVMHTAFRMLLRHVADHAHVGAIIISCGLQLVWEKVLGRYGLRQKVKVLGAGRVDDACVITPAVKATLVRRLKDEYGCRVIAIGDGPLDLLMLQEATDAVVVVGPLDSRSKSMEGALRDAMDSGRLQARQALLPAVSVPRLSAEKLPLVDIASSQFMDSITRRASKLSTCRILDATDKPATKLLMTPTRDAAVCGPALRHSHQRIGWYLANEYLAAVLGTERYPIPHVQGHETDGYRIQNEEATLIMAIMRGGEPLALGISEALPSATFMHVYEPEQAQRCHLDGKKTILLVDSVINSGATIVAFVQRIRQSHATIRIVVVAAVVQADAVREGPIAKHLQHDEALTFVTLRESENRFVGIKGTDTGNRLFNTTDLE